MDFSRIGLQITYLQGKRELNHNRPEQSNKKEANLYFTIFIVNRFIDWCRTSKCQVPNRISEFKLSDMENWLVEALIELATSDLKAAVTVTRAKCFSSSMLFGYPYAIPVSLCVKLFSDR